MSRALVQWRRGPDGEFYAVGVWLCTRTAIQSRHIPGNARVDDFFRRTHEYARPPQMEPDQPRATSWEDWADWAKDALSNGTSMMCTEVEPAPSVDVLYSREVLGGASNAPGGAVTMMTSTEVPDELGPEGRA